MRVAMVSEHASPLALLGGADAGGQNVHVAALSKALARRGAQVTVYTRRDDGALPETVRFASGVQVHHVTAGPPMALPKDDLLPHMPAMADALARVWRRERPDVVHAHFWMSGMAALAAARDLDIPVVQTFHALGVVKHRHQGEKDTSPPERVRIEHELVRDVDHIIATCTDEVFELLRLGAERAKLTVIPCGVDLDVFTPDGPVERRPLDGPAARIVSVGRLVERKGVGNLVAALGGLPDAELLIAGGPDRRELDGDPEVRRLRRLAEDHGVADRVRFRGRLQHDRVAGLLRSADVVACVPWYEPFGIVPVEAMACGVPVIASAVGGMIDTVVDGRTGIHVPPRDPERLTEALRDLLADPRLRERYGRAGVERARTHFGWGRIAAATSQTYRGLLERSGRRDGGVSIHSGAQHVRELSRALEVLHDTMGQIEAWGARLAEHLSTGGRLLVAGNGGSAAEAEHLTAELVGRFQGEREPFSAICLHADSASLTAITNDYGAHEMFARQVRAHAQPGDVLLLLSTSGRSENLLAAAEAARTRQASAWALTGAAPNPLAAACDEAVCLPAASTATVQELHLVAVHAMCAAVERAVREQQPELASGGVRG